jgi:N-methylhydantoinase B
MSNSELDPIKYEVFVRRLITLLAEARTAIAMVSGSPAIVEGGECMASIYDGEGRGILTAAGTLFHVLGAGDSIGFTIREYEDNPGIHDGDQLLYFDPYIAGTHLMDHITIKPVFYEGKRVAWVGMMTHTSDIGGVLRGISSEIFHEGIRLRGIKLAEGGKVRKDTLEIITQQCRDPDYVKIDLLATLAANNVSGDGLVRMIEKFGLDFVEAASKKLREDTAKLAKERIKSLPDGVWRERVYVSRTKEIEGKEEVVPLKMECTVTKEGDKLFFDIDASPQTEDYANATFPASRSSLFGSLAGFLFPDILWNAGMIDLVEVKITDGSFANCKFPASCGLGTMVGLTLMGVASGCIARMMFAGGYYDFVNSSWGQLGLSAGSFGPGVWYGGHSQYGGIVGQGTYDLFAGGGGATPFRDGNDTGGIYCNPTSCISDVEFTEIYWPFLFLSRYLGKDSGGYGKFRGGRNLEMIETIYGTEDLSVDYLPGPPVGEEC